MEDLDNNMAAAPQEDRIQEFIREIPFGTRLLLLVNISIYFYSLAEPGVSAYRCMFDVILLSIPSDYSACFDPFNKSVPTL